MLLYGVTELFPNYMGPSFCVFSFKYLTNNLSEMLMDF
uniref:Uncharacterized protein n=1 Tax=Arundo donax TaxID=35708 RepID=A0A0A9G825_ARUDO